MLMVFYKLYVDILWNRKDISVLFLFIYIVLRTLFYINRVEENLFLNKLKLNNSFERYNYIISLC